jgi:hypothetical protein
MSTRTRHSPDTSATHSTTSTHCQRYLPVQRRRDFLRNSAMGFGASIAGLLIAKDAGATDRKAHNSLAPREPHFPAESSFCLPVADQANSKLLTPSRHLRSTRASPSRKVSKPKAFRCNS